MGIDPKRSQFGVEVREILERREIGPTYLFCLFGVHSCLNQSSSQAS